MTTDVDAVKLVVDILDVLTQEERERVLRFVWRHYTDQPRLRAPPSAAAPTHEGLSTEDGTDQARG